MINWTQAIKLETPENLQKENLCDNNDFFYYLNSFSKYLYIYDTKYLQNYVRTNLIIFTYVNSNQTGLV